MEKLKIYGLIVKHRTETIREVYYIVNDPVIRYFEKSLSIYEMINWRVLWKSHVVGSQLTLRSLVKKGLIRMIILIKRSGCEKYYAAEKFSFVSPNYFSGKDLFGKKKKSCVLIIDKRNCNIL